jgi:hypothetical protein
MGKGPAPVAPKLLRDRAKDRLGIGGLPLCLPHREAILIAARGSVQTIHRRGGEGSAEAAKTYQRAAGRVCDGDFKTAIREADLNSLRRLGPASLCLSSSLRFAGLNRRMTPSRDRAEHGQRNGAQAKRRRTRRAKPQPQFGLPETQCQTLANNRYTSARRRVRLRLRYSLSDSHASIPWNPQADVFCR